MADLESTRRQVQSPAPFSTWVGVVFLFVLFGLIVWAVVGPSPRGDDYEKARATKRMEKLKTLNEATKKQLSTYGWVDKAKGSVHIPIRRAMELAMAELSAKKPAPAYPIATPETPAAAPAAASPAAAASVAPRTSPKATSINGPKSESGGQPAAAIKPAGAQPGTQPGASATPAASPQSSVSIPANSPTPIPSPSTPGSPLPVRGKSPQPSN